jgi:dipeptidyl aminopeptidase/acylaminoacyl peptidase
MRNHLFFALLVSLVLLPGLACGPLGGTQIDAGATATAIAGAIFATQTAEAPTPTPIIVVATNTPEPPTEEPLTLGLPTEEPSTPLAPTPTFSLLGGGAATITPQETPEQPSLPSLPQGTPELPKPPSAPQTPGADGVVTAEQGNLRSGPGTGYDTVGQVYRGDEFAVDAKDTTGNWVEVSAGDKKGWLHVDQVELNISLADVPLATDIPSPPEPQASGEGRLAFTKSPDSTFHSLWIANLDGSGQQFILDHAAGPSWSPDGQRLAFYGEEGVDRQKDADGVPWVIEGGSNGIWSMLPGVPWPQADFQQYAQEGTARWTAWAPTSDMLAYDATPGGINRRIYFLGTADNRQFDIEIPGEQADWSPDGQKLVYRSCRDNKCGLWISNRDDSGAKRITEVGDDAFPRWSPNGDKIAFSRKEKATHDIYVMNTDGGNVTQLTTDLAHDTLPAWTRNGGQIVFKSDRTGSWSIWLMGADGSGQTEIIRNVGMGRDWAFDRMDVY